MAEAVVGVLISKLITVLANEVVAGASLFWKEASALKGLFGEICKAKVELESMKAYLRDSEKFKDTDETTAIFINKIRELFFISSGSRMLSMNSCTSLRTTSMEDLQPRQRRGSRMSRFGAVLLLSSMISMPRLRTVQGGGTVMSSKECRDTLGAVTIMPHLTIKLCVLRGKRI